MLAGTVKNRIIRNDSRKSCSKPVWFSRALSSESVGNTAVPTAIASASGSMINCQA